MRTEAVSLAESAAKSVARAVTASTEPGDASSATRYVVANGGDVTDASAAPSMAKWTLAMPLASVAVVLRSITSPGYASAGAVMTTAGGVVSRASVTAIVMVASAALPAVSSARACAVNVLPAGAFAGTSAVASNGATVSVPTSTPSTSKRTDATPTLSVTRATSATASPGAVVAGPVNCSTGASVSGVVTTVT